MQYYWLNKQNNENLIVFFAGWSFDYRPFVHINSEKSDIIMFYDYNDLTVPEFLDFQNYKNKTLIAWSMGVFIAYILKDKLIKFDRKIAVNGTVYPVDDGFGIPNRMFDLTLKHAEKGLQEKFYKNVFASEEMYQKYMNNPVERTITNRVYELVFLDKLIKNTNVEYDTNFYDKAIISIYDKIIPAKNQLNFWKDKSVTVETGHFPFYNYESWNEICK